VCVFPAIFTNVWNRKKGEKDVWNVVSSLKFVGVIVLSVCVVCSISPRKFALKKRLEFFLLLKFKTHN
jgi:hypothetical protein